MRNWWKKRLPERYLHSQLFHRPPHLRQAMLIHPFPRLRHHKQMAAAVAVQRTE
jgi:hypothetical protein